MQRLWCTDSGVVGRYIRLIQKYDTTEMLQLEYAWLLNTGLTGSRKLVADSGEGHCYTMS